MAGVGPDLRAYGVESALADPALALYSGGVRIAANDDWASAPNAAAIAASGFGPNLPSEAAILLDLAPGEYTAVLFGMGATAESRNGVALVQTYDLGSGAGARVANLSTRVAVGTEEAGAIAGFEIAGPEAKTVVLRGLGPTLGTPPFNVPSALEDPEIRLFAGQTEIARNDDWGASPGDAARLEALDFAPAFASESAILIDLPPGSYTALISDSAGGAENRTGIGLFEVYAVEAR